jgi:amino acid transporter
MHISPTIKKIITAVWSAASVISIAVFAIIMATQLFFDYDLGTVCVLYLGQRNSLLQTSPLCSVTRIFGIISLLAILVLVAIRSFVVYRGIKLAPLVRLVYGVILLILCFSILVFAVIVAVGMGATCAAVVGGVDCNFIWLSTSSRDLRYINYSLIQSGVTSGVVAALLLLGMAIWDIVRYRMTRNPKVDQVEMAPPTPVRPPPPAAVSAPAPAVVAQ